MTYGRGWQPDPYDARDRSSIEVASAPILEFTPADLLDYRVGYLYQNGFSSCVAHALSRAIHMSLLIADLAAGRPPLSAMPSPGFLYFNGRRQETAERRLLGLPDLPVLDRGTQPRLMMQAARTVGYCREVDYPQDAMAEDIRGFPEANRKPPPRAYMAAVDQKNLRYSRVFATGTARQLEVSRLLVGHVPFIFALTSVDAAFMKNKGARIDAIEGGGGGHMVAGLAATNEGLFFDNWWSDAWGANGIGLLSWDVFNDPDAVTDIYAIEAAPTFSSEPA